MTDANSPEGIQEPSEELTSEFANLLSDPWVDNVAWQDFADYKFIMKPDFLDQEPPPDDPFPGLLETAIELESEGIPPEDTIEFLSRLAGVVWARYVEIEIAVIEPQGSSPQGTPGSSEVGWSMTYYSKYNFRSRFAKNLAMEQLTYAGVHAELLELYWPLGTHRRTEFLDVIAERLPPTGATSRIF